MCAIIGALVQVPTEDDVGAVNGILEHIINQSRERGRDGIGYGIYYHDHRRGYKNPQTNEIQQSEELIRCTSPMTVSFLSNLRAEPTTEWLEERLPLDQQPYTLGGWSIVHNGTIANDEDIRTFECPTNIDSAAIVEQLASNTFKINSTFNLTQCFLTSLQRLQGSYATLAVKHARTDYMFAATNYRPLWYIQTPYGFFFASSETYFPSGFVPKMLDPYSAASFSITGAVETYKVSRRVNNKALVVCSGGLDSVVAANNMVKEGYEVELLHFTYGCKSEDHEVNAVKAVAEKLGVPYTIFPLKLYNKEDSPLLDPDSTITGGEAGAEFAHEWVPARNLVLLSLATALAEAKGFETIALGNNLEEAGAYPDNEPEFINKFNKLLPFAVADGAKVEIKMPVGNLMKHEIVALGLAENAPMDLTWSCYKNGEKHCGTCGPCFMRRTAFKINGAEDPLEYLNE